MNTEHDSQRFTKKQTLKVFASTVAVAVALLLALIFVTGRVPAETFDRFYYLVLVLWAALVTAIVFTIPRAYARLTNTHLGWKVEVGGPCALVALIVYGAFHLVPRTDTFDLTLRPHGQNQPLIRQGKSRVELDNDARTETIRDNGEADFKGIPHKFWGETVRVLPQIDGYELRYQELMVDRKALDLFLKSATPPET